MEERDCTESAIAKRYDSHVQSLLVEARTLRSDDTKLTQPRRGAAHRVSNATLGGCSYIGVT